MSGRPLARRIARGELRTLTGWLRENVHLHGYRLPAEERVQAVTGRGLTDDAFIQYLRTKYGELYGVSL